MLFCTTSTAFFGFAALSAACSMPDNLDHRSIQKTAITNVHVFDGTCFRPPSTVVILNGRISNANPSGAEVVNGKGGYLIPGFIDAHCHITSCQYLDSMRQFGVTTALDMGTFPYSNITACRKPDASDVRGSGAPAAVNGSTVAKFPGFPADSIVSNPKNGAEFVGRRVAEGVDYIKVIMDPLGPDLATLSAIVKAAHKAGRLVIAHVPTHDEFALAVEAGVDIPTHVPLDKPVDDASIKDLVSSKRHVVPTLLIMQSIVNNTGTPYAAYTEAAEKSVSAMYKAGILIAAGTDANKSPFVPANPPFGESLHEELELLVAAGVSRVNAIRAATSIATSAFRLYDRGSIKPGLRADLVLLSADPTVDIRNTRSIKKVWIAGVQVTTAG